MYLSDLHIHTEFSPDSAAPMEELCEAALRQGLAEICFTDHWECGDNQMGRHMREHPFEPDRYVAEIARLRALYEGRLQIRLGLEIGNWLCDLPLGRRALQLPLDFVIGSLHIVCGEDAHRADFETHHPNELLRRYVADCGALAQQAPHFDALGHLTLIRRYAARSGLQTDLTGLAPELEQTLRTLIRQGIALEANTSGYRHLNHPLPGAEVFRLYRSLGGELVTIGSDAHRTEHLGAGLAEAQRMLRELGFTHHMTYQQRKPVPHRL